MPNAAFCDDIHLIPRRPQGFTDDFLIVGGGTAGITFSRVKKGLAHLIGFQNHLCARILVHRCVAGMGNPHASKASRGDTQAAISL
jgi:hypothetical protein